LKKQALQAVPVPFVAEKSWPPFFRVVTDLAKTGSYRSHFIIDESYNEPRAQAAIATGTLISANSINELAQKINIPPASLQATIERYNTLSRRGVDEDFGKDPSMMGAIDTSKKLYAFPLALQVYDTYGGVLTDINTHVLDNNNRVIPGLFAAGSVAFSDLINLEYPGCGFAIGTATYFGKVAGASAAAFAR
jgi:succinate dehydrogenase/fumarate reductase flavoprotein subunit